MRICGKRASQFTQSELTQMLRTWSDLKGERLTSKQVEELYKVYKIRKGGDTDGRYTQE